MATKRKAATGARRVSTPRSSITDSTALETFVCRRIQGARLTRLSCGARYTSLNAPGARAEAKATGGAACLGCAMGRAHAKGERPTRWLDGQLVELRKVRPLQQERVVWTGGS